MAATVADRLYGPAAAVAFGAAWWTARLVGRDAAAARRGFLPVAAAPCVWVHGASAGEMGAASRLVHHMRRGRGELAALYTTTNAAGLQVAARALAPGDLCSLAPWDAPAWIARAFDRVRPALLILVETELWPRLVFEAFRRAVPVLCASARIYDRDWNRYRLARPWIAPLLRRVACVAAQDATQRDRFVRLGARPEVTHAVGNLKYLDAGASAAPLELEGGGPVVVVGSPRGDEIDLIFAALAAVAPFTAARVVVAPRQVADIARVEAAAARRGWPCARRSAAARLDWRVLVLDSMGELAAAYAAAAVAIVGGGFADHGGHNPFEALRAGAPVLFGPHAANFAAETAALRRALPEACVASAAALAQRLREWLGDAARRDGALAAQRAVLPDGRALAAAYERLLGPWFDRVA